MISMCRARLTPGPPQPPDSQTRTSMEHSRAVAQLCPVVAGLITAEHWKPRARTSSQKYVMAAQEGALHIPGCVWRLREASLSVGSRRHQSPAGRRARRSTTRTTKKATATPISTRLTIGEWIARKPVVRTSGSRANGAIMMSAGHRARRVRQQYPSQPNNGDDIAASRNQRICQRSKPNMPVIEILACSTGLTVIAMNPSKAANEANVANVQARRTDAWVHPTTKGSRSQGAARRLVSTAHGCVLQLPRYWSAAPKTAASNKRMISIPVLTLVYVRVWGKIFYLPDEGDK